MPPATRSKTTPRAVVPPGEIDELLKVKAIRISFPAELGGYPTYLTVAPYRPSVVLRRLRLKAWNCLSDPVPSGISVERSSKRQRLPPGNAEETAEDDPSIPTIVLTDHLETLGAPYDDSGGLQPCQTDTPFEMYAGQLAREGKKIKAVKREYGVVSSSEKLHKGEAIDDTLFVKLLDLSHLPRAGPRVTVGCAREAIAMEAHAFTVAKSVQGLAIPRLAGVFACGELYAMVFENWGHEYKFDDMKDQAVRDEIDKAYKTILDTGIVPILQDWRWVCRGIDGRPKITTLSEVVTIESVVKWNDKKKTPKELLEREKKDWLERLHSDLFWKC